MPLNLYDSECYLDMPKTTLRCNGLIVLALLFYTPVRDFPIQESLFCINMPLVGSLARVWAPCWDGTLFNITYVMNFLPDTLLLRKRRLAGLVWWHSISWKCRLGEKLNQQWSRLYTLGLLLWLSCSKCLGRRRWSRFNCMPRLRNGSGSFFYLWQRQMSSNY